MLTIWTKHIKDEAEKTRFQNSVLGSKLVLTYLSHLLDEMEDELDRSETDIKAYDSPSWSHRQADNNGFRRCLAKVKKIIDLDQQTKDS